MLEARPRHWIGRAWDLFDGGKLVGELLPSFHLENARMRVGFRRFQIRRKRWSAGSWELQHGGKTILSAELTSPFRRRVELRHGGLRVIMTPTGMLRHGFELATPNGERVGVIRRHPWRGRRVTLEMPEDMPREMQVFSLFIATVLWNRAARASSSTSLGT